MAGSDRSEPRDALSSRRKSVAQFAGHGDRVMAGVSQLGAEGVERGLEAVEPQPERRRRLNRGFDTPIPYPRRFKMRSTDVPTNDDAHGLTKSSGDAKSEQSGGSSTSGRQRPPAFAREPLRGGGIRPE